VPTILFTVAAVLGLQQAGLSPPWVSALGWLSAAAHVLVLFTLAQRGAFAPDGIIAGLVPLTTVIWILALAATLPRLRRAAVTLGLRHPSRPRSRALLIVAAPPPTRQPLFSGLVCEIPRAMPF
jgi:hypothetical protein